MLLSCSKRAYDFKFLSLFNITVYFFTFHIRMTKMLRIWLYISENIKNIKFIVDNLIVYDKIKVQGGLFFSQSV